MRLQDLKRLGQVGTGTSGTVWLAIALITQPESFLVLPKKPFPCCKVTSMKTEFKYALKRVKKTDGKA